jgi:hypothetical protein
VQVSISQFQMKNLPVRRFGRHAELRSYRVVHSERTGVPRWALVPAGAAPVLLVGGFLVAARLQPVSYDPQRDTISALAARGATDPWVMTAAIAAVGACYLLTALGLSPLRRVGRLALAGGGVATLSIAAFPTPLHGYSGPHAVAVIAASTTMCAWPVLAVRGQPCAGVLRFGPNVAASAITFGLIMWFTLEMNGGELGLAERCAAVAPALWLFPVAFAARRAFLPGESVRREDVARAGAPAHRRSALVRGRGRGALPGAKGGYHLTGGGVDDGVPVYDDGRDRLVAVGHRSDERSCLGVLPDVDHMDRETVQPQDQAQPPAEHAARAPVHRDPGFDRGRLVGTVHGDQSTTVCGFAQRASSP